MSWKLALHTGSLGTLPLDAALTVARETGWDAVELRYADFTRATEAGSSVEDALALVKASGLPVAAVGVERGWFYAERDERQRLLGIIAEVCRWADELGAPIIMSPCDVAPGDLNQAAASLRDVGDLVAAHGKVIVLELNVSLVQFKTLQQVRTCWRWPVTRTSGCWWTPTTSSAAVGTWRRTRAWRPVRSPISSTATCQMDR